MTSTNSPEKNHRNGLRSRVLLPKHPAFVAATLLALVIFLVWAAQKWSKSDQTAGNWVNGIAAAVAVMNVLLTFYLLRTAQVQLGVLRDDLQDQRVRHEAELEAQERRRIDEADQARADLEHTQQLLDAQSAALALARSDAQQAHLETAKTRLDLSAPKCSIELDRVDSYAQMEENKERIHVMINSLDLQREFDRYSVEVKYTFRIHNWGNEPIIFSTGDPVAPNSGLVYPDTDARISFSFRHSVQDWLAIADKKRGLFNFDASSAALFEFYVNVNNIGGDVNDVHTWNNFIVPLAASEYGIWVRTGDELSKMARQVFTRKRNYLSLTESVTAADKATG